jgi:uncharacterized membrane protein YgcG
MHQMRELAVGARGWPAPRVRPPPPWRAAADARRRPRSPPPLGFSPNRFFCATQHPSVCGTCTCDHTSHTHTHTHTNTNTHTHTHILSLTHTRAHTCTHTHSPPPAARPHPEALPRGPAGGPRGGPHGGAALAVRRFPLLRAGASAGGVACAHARLACVLCFAQARERAVAPRMAAGPAMVCAVCAVAAWLAPDRERPPTEPRPPTPPPPCPSCPGCCWGRDQSMRLWVHFGFLVRCPASEFNRGPLTVDDAKVVAVRWVFSGAPERLKGRAPRRSQRLLAAARRRAAAGPRRPSRAGEAAGAAAPAARRLAWHRATIPAFAAAPHSLPQGRDRFYLGPPNIFRFHRAGGRHRTGAGGGGGGGGGGAPAAGGVAAAFRVGGGASFGSVGIQGPCGSGQPGTWHLLESRPSRLTGALQATRRPQRCMRRATPRPAARQRSPLAPPTPPGRPRSCGRPASLGCWLDRLR